LQLEASKVQHVFTILKQHGRAAIVVPDNLLFKGNQAPPVTQPRARPGFPTQSRHLWLKDESLKVSANLPDPGVLALEITEDLEAALAQFAEIAADLKK
jgi:hypothetical protein